MKKQRKIDISSLDINNIYIQIEGTGWKKPEYLSIKSLIDQVDVPDNALISLVTFEDQDVSVNNPPEHYGIGEKLQLSTDGNFLYVWITDRWKRVALSEF